MKRLIKIQKTRNFLFHFFVVLCFISVDINLMAQGDKEDVAGKPFKERMVFGGDFWLQIGTVTQIQIAPIVGYRVTNRLLYGLGPKYEYYRDNSTLGNFETIVYGGRTFFTYNVVNELNKVVPVGLNMGLFLHSEYEALSLERKYFKLLEGNNDNRFVLHSVFVGGGIFQPVGKKGAVQMVLLWNLNKDASSYYTNPIFRVGFYF